MNEHPDPRSRLSVTQLLPSVLTLAALCAGLTAIRMAVAGEFGRAAVLILLAAVLDGLDGRLARRLQCESAMGAELDSLCDFVNFGVAPALVLYLWAFQGVGDAGWIAVLVYAVACVLRLARFNVGSRDPLAATRGKTTFEGVPSPAGAMLVLLPIFVAKLVPAAVIPGPVCALWMALVAGLMVSRLPTPAFRRRVSVRRDQAGLLLLVAVAMGAALFTYPWLTLVLLDLGYLLLLVLGWTRIGQRFTRKDR